VTAIQDVPNIMLQDMATMFAGQFIGSGLSRNVYEYGVSHEYVIKFEFGHGDFQNTKEWLVWEYVREVPNVAAWFAPCKQISHMGRWLIQRRTTPVTIDELRKELPRVPAHFTDLKVGNWGRIGKRICCHDYGTSLITQEGVTTKMRRADWWQ
jgi:hypothetical protein